MRKLWFLASAIAVFATIECFAYLTFSIFCGFVNPLRYELMPKMLFMLVTSAIAAITYIASEKVYNDIF